MKALPAQVQQRLLAAALVIGFLATCYSGLLVVKYPGGAPASWMASSFLVCLMVMTKGRLRAAGVAVCGAAAFACASLETSWALLSDVVFALFAVAEAMLGAWLLCRLSRTPRLANIKQAAKLLAFVILPTTAASTLGAGLTCRLVLGRWAPMFTMEWFMGHATGMLLALPTLLVLATPQQVTPPKRRAVETLLWWATIAIFATAPFTGLATFTFIMVLPAATVFAFRLGPKPTVAIVLGITAVGDLYYYSHPDPKMWLTPLPLQTIILLGQAYNLGVYLNGLFTGLAINYQARLKQQLERRTRVARAARGRALQASRAKTEFLATMSHEIAPR